MNLDALAERISLEPDDLLFEQEDPWDAVFILTAGVVKLFGSMRDGRRQIMGFYSAGDILGAPADESNYRCSAQALTALEACVIARPDFEAFLATQPQLLKCTLEFAGREIERQREHMLLLGRKLADEKLASFLVYFAMRMGWGAGEICALQLPMSRGDIADFLGLTVESVSRAFSRFRKAGFINLRDANTVELLKPQAMASISGLEPDSIEQHFRAKAAARSRAGDGARPSGSMTDPMAC